MVVLTFLSCLIKNSTLIGHLNDFVKIFIIVNSLIFIRIKDVKLYIVFIVYMSYTIILHGFDSFFLIFSFLYSYYFLFIVFSIKSFKINNIIIHTISGILFLIIIKGLLEHDEKVLNWRLVEPHFDPILLSALVFSLLIFFWKENNFVLNLIIVFIIGLTSTRSIGIALVIFLLFELSTQFSKRKLTLLIVSSLFLIVNFYRRGDFIYQQIYGRLLPIVSHLNHIIKPFENSLPIEAHSNLSLVEGPISTGSNVLLQNLLGFGVGICTNMFVHLENIDYFGIHVKPISNHSSFIYELYFNIGIFGTFLFILYWLYFFYYSKSRFYFALLSLILTIVFLAIPINQSLLLSLLLFLSVKNYYLYKINLKIKNK